MALSGTIIQKTQYAEPQNIMW